MITDFYVADKSEAPAIAANPAAAAPALSARNADNCVLAELWSALDPDADPAALEGEDCIIFSNDGGPWVFALPEGLVTGPARLSEEGANAVCQAWAAGPEMQHLDVKEANLLGPLADLRRIASLAVETGKPLLLLMSL